MMIIEKNKVVFENPKYTKVDLMQVLGKADGTIKEHIANLKKEGKLKRVGSTKLDYSVGKINYILKALIEKGLIKVENFANSKQKKNYKYLLTPKGIEEKIKLTEKFVARKKAEYEELYQELEEYKNGDIRK